MPSAQVLVLGFLFVSFRPSLIRSRSCSSGAYLMLSLSVFPLPIRFLSSASLPVPATQPSVFPFPSSRFPLTAVPAVLLPSSVRPVSMPSFRFRYSACCNSFLRSPARFTAATPAPQPSPFRFPAVSLSFRLRFWLLSFGHASFQMHPVRFKLVVRERTSVYYHTTSRMSTTFLKFFTFFYLA